MCMLKPGRKVVLLYTFVCQLPWSSRGSGTIAAVGSPGQRHGHGGTYGASFGLHVVPKIQVMELLLHHGASDSQRDRRGSTALHIACTYGRDKAAILLLQHGSVVDEVADLGDTGMLATFFGLSFFPFDDRERKLRSRLVLPGAADASWCRLEASQSPRTFSTRTSRYE